MTKPQLAWGLTQLAKIDRVIALRLARFQRMQELLSDVHGIWIGPGDLAQSLGHLAEPGHHEVQAAIDIAIFAATNHCKPWGIPTAQVEDFKRYAGRGGTILTLGSDTRVLRAAASDLVASAKKVHG